MSDEESGSPGDSKDEASSDECTVEHSEPSEDAETEFHPFDEIDEEFKPGPAIRVMGADGLPQTVDQTEPSDIPVLSKETLICMGDFSAFVIRDEWRDVLFSFEPADIAQAPDGRWRVAESIARERITAAGHGRLPPWLALSNSETGWLEVEPLRPPCRHYVMQKTVFHLNAEHRMFPRLCSARRTTEGTFMTVRDSGMWACTMREPRDIASEKTLTDFDVFKVEQGKNRQYLPMFGGGAGIFDSPQKGTP